MTELHKSEYCLQRYNEAKKEMERAASAMREWAQEFEMAVNNETRG